MAFILSLVNICRFSISFWQFFTEFSVYHFVFSVSLCFQFITVFSVSHYVFSFSLFFPFLIVFSVYHRVFSFHCVFSFSLYFQFYVAFSVTVTTVTKVNYVSTVIFICIL